MFPEEVPQGQIWSVGERFCISDPGGWLPGNYESRDTALRALDLPCGVLQRLEDRVNKAEQRTITAEDVRLAAV